MLRRCRGTCEKNPASRQNQSLWLVRWLTCEQGVLDLLHLSNCDYQTQSDTINDFSDHKNGLSACSSLVRNSELVTFSPTVAEVSLNELVGGSRPPRSSGTPPFIPSLLSRRGSGHLLLPSISWQHPLKQLDLKMSPQAQTLSDRKISVICSPSLPWRKTLLASLW